MSADLLESPETLLENPSKLNEINREVGHVPSPRDRAIYQAICLENRSPVAVADEFHLATTTVRNIAQATQRTLARQQHELDQRSECDGLKHYYDHFALQLEEVERAWDASRRGDERVRRTTTTTTVRGPTGETQELEKIVVRREALEGPAPGGNFRLISLANRILSTLMRIETVHLVQREKEREAEEEAPWERDVRERELAAQEQAQVVREQIEQIEQMRREIAEAQAEEARRAGENEAAREVAQPPEALLPAAPASDGCEQSLSPAQGRSKKLSRRERLRQKRERKARRKARDAAGGVSAASQPATASGLTATHVAAL
jgi:hypothetical protein